jgi:hypothetical protein
MHTLHRFVCTDRYVVFVCSVFVCLCLCLCVCVCVCVWTIILDSGNGRFCTDVTMMMQLHIKIPTRTLCWLKLINTQFPKLLGPIHLFNFKPPACLLHVDPIVLFMIRERENYVGSPFLKIDLLDAIGKNKYEQ